MAQRSFIGKPPAMKTHNLIQPLLNISLLCVTFEWLGDTTAGLVEQTTCLCLFLLCRPNLFLSVSGNSDERGRETA